MVSVIIPAFNSAPSIKRAVRSVLGQTYQNLELLIVDDGSTDSTLLELKPFLSNSLVRLIRQNNSGPSFARNKGIEESSGSFIAFLDSDDAYLPDRVAESVKALETDRKADIAYSNEIFFIENNPEREIKSPHPKFSGDIFFYLKRSNFIHTSTVIARRSLFTKWQFDKDLQNHEDWDIFLKASKEGVRFRYIPKVLTRVCLSPGGLTGTSTEWARSRNIVGERAKTYWKDLKKRNFARYLRLKFNAALINFPRDERFTRPMPHDALKVG